MIYIVKLRRKPLKIKEERMSFNYQDDNVLARFFGKASNYTDIPTPLYSEYNVKKGLRNEDGTGVRIGLTKVSDVIGYEKNEAGQVIPCEGDLLYRGYSIKDLIENRKGNFGYEETCFLLLFGYLPDTAQFEDFKASLAIRYELPDKFLANEILSSPSKNLMNRLQMLTLALYNVDENPDDTDVYQTLLKGINLIAKYPALGVYSYQAKMYQLFHSSLIIHYAAGGLSPRRDSGNPRGPRRRQQLHFHGRRHRLDRDGPLFCDLRLGRIPERAQARRRERLRVGDDDRNHRAHPVQNGRGAHPPGRK